MAELNYGIMKMLGFLMTGFLPIMVAFMLLFLGLPAMGVMAAGIFVALILVLFFNTLTGMNPWIRAITGKGILIMDINSTGVGKMYNAVVRNNVTGGVDLVVDFGGGQVETMAYERSITHRIQAPIKGIITFFKGKKTINNSQEPKVVIELTSDKYQQSIFKIDYLTMAFYDSVAGVLLTKPVLSDTEKQLMIEYISLNEWRELKSLNIQMRNFTRNTFDMIANKFGGMLSNPLMLIIIVIIVIVVIAGAAIMFVPGLSEQLLGTSKQVVSTTTQAMTPLVTPTGAS
jgi:hypothetical protein